MKGSLGFDLIPNAYGGSIMVGVPIK